MKKIFAAILVLVCAAFQSNAQDEKLSDAEISFEAELHDYGTIDYASDGGHSFKFTNTGNDPLVIANCQGSCGCTVPKWPKEPILKGQSAFIDVNYDTKRPGPFTKTVTVTSNARNGTKVLTIKGVVKTQEQTEDFSPVKKESGMSPLENVNPK